MTYTHIKIERVPQKLNEDFTKNADIADQQKMLAEAAPDLLEALKAIDQQGEWSGTTWSVPAEVWRTARAAIAKAKGGL